MMQPENKNIDKLLKESLEVENTSLNFSSKVMQQIHASELEKDKALMSLLQKFTLEQPSIGFTSKVMLSLPDISQKTVYQPVISKKVWYFITVFFIFMMVYVFLNTDSVSTSEIIDPYLAKIKNIFSFNTPSLLTSPLFALSMFALSSLLLLDNFFRSKNVSKT
ncbi:MAG: hypothetical protein ABFR05_01820 [Bacteroidota bacterium]